MGNRGILHDRSGRLTNARWRHKAWVTCLLDFKGRKRPLLRPNHYTELFFLDEAVALAAGHRPCGECRRAAYTAFRAALGWQDRIQGLDKLMHDDRAIARTGQQRRHDALCDEVPNGAMILLSTGPALVWDSVVLPYGLDGYGRPQPRPVGAITLLTPPITCAALRNGYRPQLHQSALPLL